MENQSALRPTQAEIEGKTISAGKEKSLREWKRTSDPNPESHQSYSENEPNKTSCKNKFFYLNRQPLSSFD
jgi:hypothetical protein